MLYTLTSVVTPRITYEIVSKPSQAVSHTKSPEPGAPLAAIDIGASPGGWTKVLSEWAGPAGRVAAVDPAGVVASVTALPNVVSERFRLTPLQNCLFTPELQWQFQG